jgi:decaprenyl-phosphate phosphoribosyltransferase
LLWDGGPGPTVNGGGMSEIVTNVLPDVAYMWRACRPFRPPQCPHRKPISAQFVRRDVDDYNGFVYMRMPVAFGIAILRRGLFMAKREAPLSAMLQMDANSAGSPRLQNYIGIARPDHWIKNIFMLPGVAAAFAVVQPELGPLAWRFVVGLVSLCLVASANYTINEYLDSEFDRFHPVKRLRAGAQGLLDARLVAIQYAALVAIGLLTAWAVNIPFLLTSVALLAMGLIYNVAPIRTKDKAYLDTLSESINNPIRFLLGWFIVAPAYLPPGSALLAYWMGGAFLMGVKRYSEYRGIADPSRAALYRRSFGHYTERSLLLSSFFYALCSAFFIAVFLIKYRIEFLLMAPLFGLLFTWYLAIGIRKDSAAQAPEKLYQEVSFLGFAVFTFVFSVLMFFIDIPFLHGLMEPHVIQFNLTQH